MKFNASFEMEVQSLINNLCNAENLELVHLREAVNRTINHRMG